MDSAADSMERRAQRIDWNHDRGYVGRSSRSKTSCSTLRDRTMSRSPRSASSMSSTTSLRTRSAVSGLHSRSFLSSCLAKTSMDLHHRVADRARSAINGSRIPRKCHKADHSIAASRALAVVRIHRKGPCRAVQPVELRESCRFASWFGHDQRRHMSRTIETMRTTAYSA